MKITWDTKNKNECDFAEKAHRHAVEKPETWQGTPMTAYYESGVRKRKMDKFDPKAGAMILVAS